MLGNHKPNCQCMACRMVKREFVGDNNLMYGKHWNHSEEAKQKIREANLGRRHTEKAKRKNREAHLGQNNSMYGRKHSKETIQKMILRKLDKNNPMFGKSAWNKGKKLRPRSEETKRKQREKLKGISYEKLYGKKRAKKIIQSKSGENHWNWQGGKSFELYGEEFNDKLKLFIKIGRASCRERV